MLVVYIDISAWFKDTESAVNCKYLQSKLVIQINYACNISGKIGLLISTYVVFVIISNNSNSGYWL